MMNDYTRTLLGVVVGMTSILPVMAHAVDTIQFLPSYITESLIDGNAASGIQGATGINLVAGDANQQANAAAIAISPNGTAITSTRVHQSTALGQGNAPDISIASIRDKAFMNSTGVLSINQISGVSNAQVNGLSLSLGIDGTAITDVELSQSITGQAPDLVSNGLVSPGVRIADIEATTFENSRGIVQINQTAGSGNATRNNFALRSSGSVK